MDSDNNNYELLDVLNKILEKKTYPEIAKNLNVATGTVKRWSD